MDLGLAEQQYCVHAHISPAILCQTTPRDSGVLHLLNQLLNLLQIQGFAPLGFSQQYETQQDTLEKVFYVEGAWCCNFLFRLKATQRDLQDEWTSVEVRVCPAALLSAIRQTRLPTIFQTTTSLDAPWTSILQEIALDPEEYSRGCWANSLLCKWRESNVSSQLLARQTHGER